MMQDAMHKLRKHGLGGLIALLSLATVFGLFVTLPQAAVAVTSAKVSDPAVNSFSPANRRLTTVRYEAEEAYLTGGTHVDTSATGYTGSGYVNGYTAVGAETIFTVNVPKDRDYVVTLRYANGSGKNETLDISVNGLKSHEITLRPTGGWGIWADKAEKLDLRAGLNTLAYMYAQGDSGNVSLDSISIPDDNGLAARGATLPYTEYEAEAAATNGTLLGPDRAYLTMPAEASGREAVRLQGQGQYVEFTLTQPANALSIRYSIPDSADGAGLTAPLSLYVNGKHRLNLSLTSKYSWVYGSYPYTNNPADGNPHHFFDETRTLLGATLPAGTHVRLQVDAGDSAPWYVLDLADFYRVAAPYERPANSLSITQFGADPSGAKDSTQAVQKAVNAAESNGKSVWIPAGTFTVTGHISVNNVTVRGAGPWYSILHGAGVGIYGNSPSNPSTNVHLYDFALFGETTVRNDSTVDSGVGGSLSGGSVVQNIWIEHIKVGMWFDGPFSGLLVVGDTIRDTFADGINLFAGVSNTTVEQTQVRNTGDDGIAMWSAAWASKTTDQNDLVAFNTVQLPMLANCSGVYGGSNNSVTDNVLADTVSTGGGVNIGNIFGAIPLAGTTTVARNTLIRTGAIDRNTQIGLKQDGAIWLLANDSSITGAINVTGNEIDDSTYAAIAFVSPNSNSITNATFSNDTIKTAGTYAIQEEAPGSATFTNVTATNLGIGGQYNCGSGFTIVQGPGNAGWSGVSCPTPTPIPTPPPPPAPTGTLVTAINAGGTAVGNFKADTDYDQGNQYSDTSTAIDTSNVNAPPPQAVYQTLRWNSAFTYTIPGLTPGSSYLVQLDWAELSFHGAGQRQFNVAINGSTVLSNFDVYASSGYKKALAKQFTVTANSSGQIVISFSKGAADNPFISGIEVYTSK